MKPMLAALGVLFVVIVVTLLWDSVRAKEAAANTVDVAAKVCLDAGGWPVVAAVPGRRGVVCIPTQLGVLLEPKEK